MAFAKAAQVMGAAPHDVPYIAVPLHILSTKICLTSKKTCGLWRSWDSASLPAELQAAVRPVVECAVAFSVLQVDPTGRVADEG